jgi:predicted RNase H-like HicB family nuclease
MGEPNMQTATDSSAFQQAIEGVERLSGDDQILLVEIIRQRLIQHRRSESVTQVAEAGEAYQTGNMQRGAPENLTQALDGLKAAGGQAIRQVVISRGEDGYWVAECPTLPGCISQGRSREETVANIREAIRGYITALQEDALPVPGEHFDTLVLAV